MSGPVNYRVRVRGRLTVTGGAWFEDLSATATPEGDDTVIGGQLPDQSALHGLLGRVRDLGLELVSVETFAQEHSEQSTSEV
jgi:hypothetical protein